VPQLAARRAAVPLLLRHLFAEIGREDAELGQRFSLPNGLPRLGPEFLQRLVQHPLTANVRELRQILWAALAESPDDALEWPARAGHQSRESGDDDPSRAQIEHALEANNGSLEKTWRALGLSNRYVLRRLIAKYDLSVTRRGKG
jgi:DNA-binding NtrC family response regulator